MSGVSPSPPFTTLISSINSNNQRTTAFSYANAISSVSKPKITDLKLKKQVGLFRFGNQTHSRSVNLRCNSTTGPSGPGSGDNENKNILDAFFLGKALAEAVNERIESAVGEFLSTIGRLQAEQQKQIQDFQEDVIERAKKAKENAAREALEAQGLVPKHPTVDAAATTYGANASTSSPTSSAVTPTNSPLATNSSSIPTAHPAGKGPTFEGSNDD